MKLVSRLALIGLCSVAAPAAAQPYHMEDTLRGSSAGNTSGGTFGSDGWTVTAVDDQIWYALPRLTSGSIELTVANITLGNLPLGDHEIFAMYEDGYGIGEPINYAPEFRVNHYKAMIRIYGTAEPGRAGHVKLMWGMCPSGAPGYDTCGCGGFFAEPFDDPGAWTGAAVRLRLEWGGGHTRLLRDGVEVVGVDWSSSGFSFGPSELHMMLGSPRNDGGLSAMPIGATFSDLVVDGSMGPLATCPGTSIPDAGPLPDAGVCPGDAVTADATAASWETGVFPDVTDLNVEGSPGVPSGVVYLRFPPVAGPVSHATLTMHTSTVASAGGGSGEVCRVDAATWSESTLTWATRPAVSTTCSGGAHTVGAGETVTWDVTALVAPGGPIDLAIVSVDDDGAHYVSREAGGCTLGARLEVELAPGVDGGPVVVTDGGSTVGMDGSVPGTDGGGASADAGTRNRMTSAGCGCSATTTSGRGLAVISLVLLAALSCRRGRRGRPRT